MTESEKAIRDIRQGAKYPYDAPDQGEPRAAIDNAHKIARGILYDLNDRRGIKWELNKVDFDTRCEIIDSIAEIIRQGGIEGTEAVGEVVIEPFGALDMDITAIKWLGDYRPKLADKLYTTPPDQTALINELTDCLEAAQNGLKWYQDEHPEDSSEADGELHTRIDQAIAKKGKSL